MTMITTTALLQPIVNAQQCAILLHICTLRGQHAGDRPTDRRKWSLIAAVVVAPSEQRHKQQADTDTATGNFEIFYR